MYTLELNHCATDVKSQADTPIWRDLSCFPRLHPGCSFFVSGERFFFEVFQTGKNDFQLSDFVGYGQGLGLMFRVVLTLTITSRVIIPRASLSETTGIDTREHPLHPGITSGYCGGPTTRHLICLMSN